MRSEPVWVTKPAHSIHHAARTYYRQRTSPGNRPLWRKSARPARCGTARACGWLSAPVGCVVLLDHGGRDAPALTDRHAVLFRPGPDITRALPVGGLPPRPARRCPPVPAGMLEVGRELLGERGGVLGIQVDLIVGAFEREPDGLLGRAAAQVVFEDDAYFLGHLNLPDLNGACTVSRPASCDRAQRRGPGMGPAEFFSGQTSIFDSRHWPCGYAQLLMLADTCARIAADLVGEPLVGKSLAWVPNWRFCSACPFPVSGRVAVALKLRLGFLRVRPSPWVLRGHLWCLPPVTADGEGRRSTVTVGRPW